MEKIAVDVLSLEVTRRCNMQPPCAHCFRGKAQNIDLNIAAVDNLLGQVSAIGYLFLTGGEPIVNLPTIEYIFQKIKENNIQLFSFGLVTNGLVYSDDFESLINDVDAYIRRINSDERIPHITIAVSQDKYHRNKNGAEFIELCKKQFSHCSIAVSPQLTGMSPMKVGNATSLPDSETLAYFKQAYDALSQIEYWRPCDVLPVCKHLAVDNVKHAPIILTPLYLTAKGHLHTSATVCTNDYEYVDAQEAVCDLNISCDLIDKIDGYNMGRKTEFECLIEEQETRSVVDDFHEAAEAFIRVLCVAQEPSYKLPKQDQVLAQNDLQEILTIHESNPDCSLYVSLLQWIYKKQNILWENNEARTAFSKARNEALKQLYQYGNQLLK